VSGVLIAAALADMVLGPMVAEGKATRYSKGVMPEVVAARWELAQQIGVIDAPLQGVKVYLWDD